MNIHDTSYKDIFSFPIIVQQLIERFLNDDVEPSTLDFSTLEKVNAEFLSDKQHSRRSDVIWRLKCQNDWLYVYLMIEFQSSVDGWMAIRMLSYHSLLWQDLIKQNKLRPSDKLPAIFPIVIYSGDRPWDAALTVADIVNAPSFLIDYQPDFSYKLIDEQRFKSESLWKENNLIATLFLTEQARSADEMIAVELQFERLLPVVQAPGLERALAHRLSWAMSKQVESPVELVDNLIGVRQMLSERKTWEQQFRDEMAEMQQVIDDKRREVDIKTQEIDIKTQEIEAKFRQLTSQQSDIEKQAREDGLIQNQIEILSKLINARFFEVDVLPHQVTDKLNALTIEQRNCMIDEIFRAETLDSLFAVCNK